MSVACGVIVLAMALAVAGCTGNPSQTGAPVSTGSAPSVGSGGGTGGPGTTYHLAADLEARLPTVAGGAAMTKESVVGAGFQGIRLNHAGLRCRWYETRGLRCRDQQQLNDVLARLSRSLDDVSIAVAYDRTRTTVIEVQALRINGSTGEEILAAVLAVEAGGASTSGGSTVTVVEIGGRSVTLLRPGRPYPSGDRYRFASGDVLYEIRKADEATVSAIIAKLP